MSTSNGGIKTIEVIDIIDSDDDEHDSSNLKPVPDTHENNNSASTFVLPQTQDIFQVEEYFLPSKDDSSDYHNYIQRSKETFSGTLENQVAVEEMLEKDFLNSMVGDTVSHQNSGEQTRLSFQELSDGCDDQETMWNKLQRLAKDLDEVISVSLGSRNSNTKQLSNIEKTIWEVSQSDFDISGLVHARRSKKFPFSPRNKISKYSQKTCTMGVFENAITVGESQALRLSEQPTPVKKKHRRPSCQKNDNLSLDLKENQSNLSHIDKKSRPPLILRISKSGNFHNATLTQSNVVTLPKSKDDSIDIIGNRDESLNLKHKAEIYKDVSFTTVQSVNNETLEVGTDNNNISQKNGHETHSDKIAPREISVDTIKSTKGVVHHQDTSTVMTEFEQLSSTARDTSMNTFDTQENYESYCCEELNENQEKGDSGEICRFHQNSKYINNVFPKESNVRAISSLSSTTELTIQDPKLYQCNSELPVLPNLSDKGNEISQTEFLTCYYRIFDDYVTNLYTKMGDIFFLLMDEEDIYNQRLEASVKITCEQLREKEKEILKTNFLKIYNKYKTSFAKMFQDIVTVIVSNASTIELQKYLLLSWFVKLFLKIKNLTELDSPTSVWKKIIDLLSNYENPPPMMEEIFSLSEVDFEKECWKTLGLILQDFSEESDPEKNSVLEVAVEETRVAELQATMSNSMEPPEIKSRCSRQSVSNSTDIFLGKMCETEVQNINYNPEKIGIPSKTSQKEVSVTINQQLLTNILVTASRTQPKSLKTQLASQGHQSNCKAADGPVIGKDTSISTGTINHFMETITGTENKMKNTSQSVSPTHGPDIIPPENTANLSSRTRHSTVIKSNREFETSSKNMKRKTGSNFEHTIVKKCKTVKKCAEILSVCDAQSQQSETNVVDSCKIVPPVSTNVPCTTTSTVEKSNSRDNQPYYYFNSKTKKIPIVRTDKHSIKITQCRQNTSGCISKSYPVSLGLGGYSKSSPNTQENLRSNNVNTNFQSGSHFLQSGHTHQHSLPQSNAPPTVTNHVNSYGNSSNVQPTSYSSHTQYAKGPQPQYSRTNLIQTKTCQTQNQQMPHPVNVHSYSGGMSNYNNHYPYPTDGTELDPQYINQSSLEKQLISSNTATDKVFKSNQDEPNQTVHTTPQSNFTNCVSDFTETLKKQVASGTLTISSVKESQTSEDSCQDTEQSVVPEILPNETLHYKPSPSNQS